MRYVVGRCCRVINGAVGLICLDVSRCVVSTLKKDKMNAIYKTNIREYTEGSNVIIEETDDALLIIASNEGGYNRTAVDAKDVLGWLLKYKPELLNSRKIKDSTVLSDAIQWMSTYRAKIFRKMVMDVIDARE